MRIANASLHALHLSLIGFCIVGWALPSTRGLHLLVCLVILASWFVLGPMIGRPGFCLLTGLQHRLWKKQGRTEMPDYMAYLFQRLVGHAPGSQGQRVIEWGTQAVLYTCLALSIGLR